MLLAEKDLLRIFEATRAIASTFVYLNSSKKS